MTQKVLAPESFITNTGIQISRRSDHSITLYDVTRPDEKVHILREDWEAVERFFKNCGPGSLL